MPIFIPVILGGAIIASLGKGASKGKQGLDDTLAAKKIVDTAKELHQQKLSELDHGGMFLARRFKEFEVTKIEIKISTITDFFEFLKRLDRLGKRKEASKESCSVPGGDKFSLDFQGRFLEVQAVIQGGKNAFAAGTAAGQGAATLVGTFGTASTGAAISGLSGAAAQSAFLAWLGGGSLAAGGGGMALGSIILGGIYVAPAALIGGFVLASQSQKALTQARAYEASVDVANQQIAGQVAFLRRAGRRIDELESLAVKLADRANEVMENLDPELIVSGNEYARSQFETLWSLFRALTEILRVKVFTDDMDLNPESRKVIENNKEL